MDEVREEILVWDQDACDAVLASPSTARRLDFDRETDETTATMAEICGWPPGFTPIAVDFPEIPNHVLGVMRGGEIVLSVEFEK